MPFGLFRFKITFETVSGLIFGFLGQWIGPLKDVATENNADTRLCRIPNHDSSVGAV
jgi:hypothetical protein